MARGRLWSEAELRVLEHGWHHGTDLDVIASKIDRTPVACRLKATMLGFGRRGGSMLSLAEASRRTGISRVTIARVVRSLHLFSERGGGYRRYLITEEGLKRVIAATTPRKRAANWGEVTHPLRAKIRKASACPFTPVRQLPPACVECGTNERPHKARNMCGACYARTSYRARKQGRQW